LDARALGSTRKRRRFALSQPERHEGAESLVDARIFDWHKEAEGYKIRHVPAALPDMLKTRAMLEWEYAPHLGRSASQAIGAAQDSLD
jgi:hypothetical protein